MSDLPSWCRVGVKVVCVVPCWYDGDQQCDGPHYGAECTIRRVTLDREGWAIELEEFRGALDQFLIDGFRPAVAGGADAEIEAKLYHKKGLHQSAPRRKSVGA